MTASNGTIPVIVVSGFLGSGKTTLIRRILADPRASDSALIVNEFGKVGIDHHLFRKTDERTTLLRNGCVCCSLRDDLKDAMRELIDKRDRGEIPPFTRLIIETTGLADPGPILHTIVSDPLLRHRYRMERVLTTLDAVSGLTNLSTYGEAMRQVTAADLVAITKLDLVPPQDVATVRQAVARLNPIAQVADAPHGQIDLDLLFADPVSRAGAEKGRFDPSEANVGVHEPRSLQVRTGPGAGHPLGVASVGVRASRANAMPLPAVMHAAAGTIASHTLTFDTPLDWRMFGVWLTLLLHQHGERVLRMKGLLNVGAERGPLLLEGAQHVMHAPRHLQNWPDDDRQSRLVFIVRDLDGEALRDSLLAFQEAAARG